MSDLMISYSDCLRFLNIDSETAKDFEGTLCILPSGISRIDPTRHGVPLYPDEIDALCLAGEGTKEQKRPEEYRGARQFDKIPIGEPLITFPEPWYRFKLFIDWAGWTGYIDAVKAVEWLLKRVYLSEDTAEIQSDTLPGQAELPAPETAQSSQEPSQPSSAGKKPILEERRKAIANILRVLGEIDPAFDPNQMRGQKEQFNTMCKMIYPAPGLFDKGPQTFDNAIQKLALFCGGAQPTDYYSKHLAQVKTILVPTKKNSSNN